VPFDIENVANTVVPAFNSTLPLGSTMPEAGVTLNVTMVLAGYTIVLGENDIAVVVAINAFCAREGTQNTTTTERTANRTRRMALPAFKCEATPAL
jgi:hypothetical protein